MTNLAIFASGSGTNAQRIAGCFGGHPSIRVALIVSNNPDAFVLERARLLGIPSAVISARTLRESAEVLDLLGKYDIGFIVLAGFLLLVPDYLVKAFDGKIVNIHPALLPKYGGKGMFGHHVHEAVLASGDRESGITVHYVNDRYDEGDIIFQARCPVMPGDTPDRLADRIHELEYRHYPAVIERLLLGDLPAEGRRSPVSPKG